jgi:uncharacterized protein (TIRG00374 family)
MNRKILLSIIVGLCFSAATIYMAFRNIPFGDLVLYLGSVNYFWLIPSASIAILSFILRVFRWQWILKNHKRIPFIKVYHPLMIGFMLNCVLPGRLGEFARPVLLKKEENIPFSTGLGSIVTERLFDMICLIVLLTAVLTFMDIDRSLTVSVGRYVLNAGTLEKAARGVAEFCALVISGVVAVNIRFCREFIAKCILFVPKMFFFVSNDKKKTLEKKIAEPLVKLMNHFAEGLSLFKNPIKTLGGLGISMVIWMIQAFSYHLMTFSCPGLSISYTQTMTVMIMICFFIALPSVPGYWGLWEAGGVFALSLFSVARNQAAGYTLINHVVQIAPTIIAGLVSALIVGVNFRQLYRQTAEDACLDTKG